MSQVVPVSVYAEMTPNPAVLKFVANKRIIQMDSIEFKNIEEAKSSPLVTKLFHYPFVKEVFISGNYIAITKYDIIEWEEVSMEVRELVREYLASGQEIMAIIPDLETSTADSNVVAQSIDPNIKDAADWEDIEVRISELLDEYVKPAVEQDGGNIKFLELRDGVAKVMMQGACSGCPSSTQTLSQGIHNLLNQMLPGQVNSVEAING